MDLEVARCRQSCHLHAMTRAAEREIPLTAQDVAAIEATIERMRPCFEAAERRRHVLRLSHAGERLTVVYDAELAALVTVWRTGCAKETRP